MPLNDAIGYFVMASATTIGIVTLGVAVVLFGYAALRLLLAVILVVPLGIACMVIDAYETYKQNKLTRLGVTT